MYDYDRLSDEFRHKAVELQKTCPHKKTTAWIAEWWAVGHSTGRQIKVCLNCNKIVKTKEDGKRKKD